MLYLGFEDAEEDDDDDESDGPDELPGPKQTRVATSIIGLQSLYASDATTPLIFKKRVI